MRRIVGFIAVLILCIFVISPAVSQADRQRLQDSDIKNIVVEIDYGDILPSREIEIPWVKNKTVLEALQTIATVETHPVGQYVMVVSIDGVKGERGKMAWYYTINGKSPDKIAYSKAADNAEHIKWTYKKDVCSEKVDLKKKN